METTTPADRAMPGGPAPPRSPAMRKILGANWFSGEAPRKHEFVFVDTLPKCDFCPACANYDGRMRGRSSWAYACHLHFEEYGMSLGLGRGQRLILRGDA